MEEALMAREKDVSKVVTKEVLGAKLFVFLGVWRVCVESSHRVCV